jgi:uncharacterized protein (TIGR02145 family)
MKKIFTLLIGIAFSIVIINAQPPYKFSYKATITRTNGSIVANKTIALRITILPEGHVETFTPTTNEFGQIDIVIGGGMSDLSSIIWSTGDHFLRVEVDVKGGNAYQLLSETQLLSVPYALYAGGVDYNNLFNQPTIPKKVSQLDQDVPYLTTEVDGSITNEMQTLSLSGDQLTISGTGGNAVTFTNWDMDANNDVTTSGNQTIAGNKTFTGKTTVQTPINPSDAVTKAYVDDLLAKIGELEGLTTKIKDADGNLYSAVKIGNQIWMGENLRTTKYNDGTPIPLKTDNLEWGELNEAYCWYDNDEVKYKSTYGALYNWLTISTGKLCPTGWHVPGENGWIILRDYLGGTVVAGGKLKETGTTHWPIYNTEATNESGFTALPGGNRGPDGTFYFNGYAGDWWSTQNYSIQAYSVRISYEWSSLLIGLQDIQRGMSVRCMKDQ